MICAEGYVFTFTRRGYIGTGLWTPQFVLDYPEVLREAHYDFVRAGSDVVQALQVGEEAISTSPCAIHVFCLVSQFSTMLTEKRSGKLERRIFLRRSTEWLCELQEK